MKKFIVDFEGEEEVGEEEELVRDGMPDFLIFRSSYSGAMTLCHSISALGIPVWFVKYKHIKSLIERGTSSSSFFAAGVYRGPGVKLVAGDEKRLKTELEQRHVHVRVMIKGQTFDADPIENAEIIDIKPWVTTT